MPWKVCVSCLWTFLGVSIFDNKVMFSKDHVAGPEDLLRRVFNDNHYENMPIQIH